MEEWMRSLVQCEFFGSCDDHQRETRNEKNLFCIDCCCSLCRRCRNDHHGQHRCLQIYKHLLRDVIRCRDFLDAITCIDFKKGCSKIQTHMSNSKKVFHIAPIPAPAGRQNISRSINLKSCKGCWRHLRSRSDVSYCSVACKISRVHADSSDDDNKPSLGDRSGHDSGSNNKDSSAEANCSGSSSSKQTLMKRRSNMNKRKGIPRRAPFF